MPKPSIPLHDKRFVYIGSRDHDADSTKFRERQRERMKAAQSKPQPVTSINRRKQTA